MKITYVELSIVDKVLQEHYKNSIESLEVNEEDWEEFEEYCNGGIDYKFKQYKEKDFYVMTFLNRDRVRESITVSREEY